MKKLLILLVLMLLPLISASYSTVLYDDFGDSSIDTSKWIESNQDAGSDVTEGNGNLNLSTGSGSAHTGTSVYTFDNFTAERKYIIDFNWSFNWSESKAGHDGIFLVASHCYAGDDCRDTSYYNVPVGDAIFINLGKGCASSTEVLKIFADDDSTAWHCAWEETVFDPGIASPLSTNTIYNIKITIDFDSRNVSVYKDGTIYGSGIVSAARMEELTNDGKFKVEMHVSHYPYSSNKEEDWYDYMNISWEDSTAQTCDYADLTSSLTLTSNNESCFNIASDNIKLDCAGYDLSSIGNVYDDYVITINERDNVTIENCNFKDWSLGIYANSTTNLIINNNNFTNFTDYSDEEVYVYGINSINSDGAIMTNLNFTDLLVNSSSVGGCHSGESTAILINSAPNTTLENITIKNTNGETQGSSGEGGCNEEERSKKGDAIEIIGSSGTTLNKITIKDMLNGITSSGNSYYMNFTEVNITGRNYLDDGMYLVDVDYLDIQNSYFEELGICIYAESTAYLDVRDSVFERCESGIHSNLWYGVWNNNIMRNFYDTSGASINYGMYINALFMSPIDNNTFINMSGKGAINSQRLLTLSNNKIINYTKIAITFGPSSDDTQLINNTITNFLGGNASYIPNSAKDIDFINNTYDLSTVAITGSGSMHDKQYLGVNITNDTYSPLEGASVNVSNGSYSETKQTNTKGITELYLLTNFFKNSTNTIYHPNYNVVATKTNYTQNSTEINITETNEVHLTLELAADESSGRTAIEEGISNITPNATIHADLEIDIRYFNGTQDTGVFDKISFLENQTWAFNYVTEGQNFTNLVSGSFNIFNVWENSGLVYSDIVSQVENFINSTLF